MSYQYLHWKKKGKWGILEIDHPPVNALNRKVLEELHEFISKDLPQEKVRILLLGARGKTFIAGADIGELKELGPKTIQEFLEIAHSTLQSIEESPIIFIALIHGFALGGGLEFALACDIRIATEKAQLGLPEVQLGLFPGFGGTQRLTRHVGEGLAKYWILTGKRISAKEAWEKGLVHKVVPQEKLREEGEKLAQELLEKGPQALQYAKRLIHLSLEKPLAEGLQEEKKAFVNLFHTKEPYIGLNAFLEKKKPSFEEG